jgi:DNA-binding NarL/FixJ family response regulator
MSHGDTVPYAAPRKGSTGGDRGTMAETRSNRALIVDDDDDMRFLVRTIIEAANEGLAVAGEARDGDEAVERWRSVRPDVVVLDYRMPGRTGLDVAAEILAEQPDQSIILFSAYLDDDTRQRADDIGVRACLSKDAYDELPAALWRYGPAA